MKIIQVSLCCFLLVRQRSMRLHNRLGLWSANVDTGGILMSVPEACATRASDVHDPL